VLYPPAEVNVLYATMIFSQIPTKTPVLMMTLPSTSLPHIHYKLIKKLVSIK